MEDSCPFCNDPLEREQTSPFYPIKIWDCGTTQYLEGYHRNPSCYANELHRREELLREARDLINQVIENSIHRDNTDKVSSGDFYCHVCVSWNHNADKECLVKKLQTFLSNPEIKKIMEEKIMDKKP